VSRFLVLYRAPVSAREQIESSTPEQRQTGMELWQTWAAKAGSAIVDLGAPLGDGAIVGDGDAYNDIAGFSILDAHSQQAVMGLLRDHRTSTRRRADRDPRDAAPAGDVAARHPPRRCEVPKGAAPVRAHTVKRVTSG
jgi:hypothetical protein